MDQRPQPPRFYETEPHQPTYRPEPYPAAELERTSLLDLGPPGSRSGDGDEDLRADGWPRVVVAATGLTTLVLLAAGTILGALYLHHDDPGASATGAISARATSKTPSPAPRSRAQVAAASIDTAITRSVAARKLIGPAKTHTRSCRATKADVTALDTAATTRSKLATGLGDLDVHALAGGAAVVTNLRQAWTYSARADRSYATWARHHLSCSGHATTHGNADWDRAHHNDTLSSAAKARAVKTWNPLARRYHLTVRKAGKI